MIFFGRDLAQGRGQGGAGPPEGGDLFGTGGGAQVQEPGHPRGLGDGGGGLVDTMGRAIHLDHEQGAGPRGQAQIADMPGHGNRGAVHEFQGAGGDGLGHDGGDGGGGGMDVGVAGAQGAAGLRQGGELEGGLGDEGQGTLGADDEPGQVVADHALGGPHPGAHELPGAGDRRQSQGILARGAVLDRAGAGGVAGQIAAQGTGSGAGGVRWPEKAMGRQRRLQGLVGDARLHDRQAVVRVDIEDALHPLEGEDQATPIRHRGAGGAGAAPARDQRQTFPIAELDQGHDLVGGLDQDHGLGHGLAAAVVVAVGPAFRRVQQEGPGPGDGPEFPGRPDPQGVRGCHRGQGR